MLRNSPSHVILSAEGAKDLVFEILSAEGRTRLLFGGRFAQNDGEVRFSDKRGLFQYMIKIYRVIALNTRAYHQVLERIILEHLE